MITRAFERVGTYYYLLPSYTQAKKVIWDNIDNDGFRMLDHIPLGLIKATNSTEQKIELINGSIIQLIAANEFKQSGVGSNPIGVVFSEFSISSEEAWRYLSPILAANGGWAIFNFTPRGTNHAWTLYQQALNNPLWFCQVLTVDDTGVFTKEALEEEKRNNPQSFFEQEYYCRFIEGASAFFRRVSENIYELEIDHTDHQIQLGIDLAKYQDWTVITPFCLTCFKTLPQERFNQIDWNLQKARIEASYHRYGAIKATVDATGVGDPIVEDLARMNMNIEPFKFTGGDYGTRRQLLNHLAILLEQDKIKLWKDDGLEGELKSFAYRIPEQGRKVEIAVPDGMTDDRVMSLALSVWGATEPVKTVLEDYGMYSQNYK